MFNKRTVDKLQRRITALERQLDFAAQSLESVQRHWHGAMNHEQDFVNCREGSCKLHHEHVMPLVTARPQ